MTDESNDFLWGKVWHLSWMLLNQDSFFLSFTDRTQNHAVRGSMEIESQSVAPHSSISRSVLNAGAILEA